MKKKFYPLYILLCLLGTVSCNSDDNQLDTPDVMEPPIEEILLSEEVEVYKADRLENSLSLVVLNGGKSSYLVDKKGEIMKVWNFDIALGNDLELLPDGKLLGIFKAANPSFSFGGFGGIIRIINVDGSIDWQFDYHSENYLSHHDVEMLPNGNVLFIAWERILALDAQNMGIDVNHDVFSESIIEVNPNNDQIVWEWHTKDHLVQDI